MFVCIIWIKALPTIDNYINVDDNTILTMLDRLMRELVIQRSWIHTLVLRGLPL